MVCDIKEYQGESDGIRYYSDSEGRWYMVMILSIVRIYGMVLEYIKGDGMIYMVYIEISGGYSIIIGGSNEDIVYIM